MKVMNVELNKADWKINGIGILLAAIGALAAMLKLRFWYIPTILAFIFVFISHIMWHQRMMKECHYSYAKKPIMEKG